ncbi:BA75_01821T0 [Komagataella pastoris]|uniref:BA75_01821T0 n=1 Tax=Komagataella pastoris TaxID=4922 RepID=A0A1B2J6J8_PICPA|nr:BA75_01821T0 [Komagataella pastoris]
MRRFLTTTSRPTSKQALSKRLEQLAEDAIEESPSLLHTPEFKQILNSLSDSEFKAKYTKELGYANSARSRFIPKQSQEIALSQPWTGTESQADAALRMLVDKYKPSRLTKSQIRLSSARDASLDYKISKISKKETSFEEDPHFRERYKERLLGPDLLVPSSFATVNNSIKSIANTKIEQAMSEGKFKNLSNRGKPIKIDSSSQSAFIDKTEYHLNNILKNENALPPWIEKQGMVFSVIKSFRNELDKSWKLKLANHIKSLPLSLEQKLAHPIDVKSNPKVYRISSAEKESLSVKLNSLNSSLRSYNLQAPLPSQKMYLSLEKELQNCFGRVSKTSQEIILRHLTGSPAESNANSLSTAKNKELPTFKDIPQRSNIYQHSTEPLGKLFLNLFKRKY